MIVDFHEPPEPLMLGGLDPAIRSLEAYLNSQGITVRCRREGVEDGLDGAPDVAHIHTLWRPELLRVSAGCRRDGIPYVVSPHGMLEPWAWRAKRWKKWPWFQLFERRHLMGAARLLTTSEQESRNLRKLMPRARCVALPLGMATRTKPDYAAARRELGWGKDEIVLLYLSRIHPKKGLDLLLAALAREGKASARPVRLVIVGDGDWEYVSRLKAFAGHERERLPRVDWIGEVWGEEKWKYFQAADLFCLTSHSENFGIAVLEALQVGTRVLVSDQTPWGEVPEWGAGFVVSPDEQEIAAGFRKFFGGARWTNDERENLARMIHEKFSWDAVGPGYVRLYEEITKQGA